MKTHIFNKNGWRLDGTSQLCSCVDDSMIDDKRKKVIQMKWLVKCCDVSADEADVKVADAASDALSPQQRPLGMAASRLLRRSSSSTSKAKMLIPASANLDKRPRNVLVIGFLSSEKDAIIKHMTVGLGLLVGRESWCISMRYEDGITRGVMWSLPCHRDTWHRFIFYVYKWVVVEHQVKVTAIYWVFPSSWYQLLQ